MQVVFKADFTIHVHLPGLFHETFNHFQGMFMKI